jgi:CheY-like chemotaxis protein
VSELLRPHTPEWFDRLRAKDPDRAKHVEELIELAGSSDVCSYCGDDPARDYLWTDKPGESIRLCRDCYKMGRADGESLEPIYEHHYGSTKTLEGGETVLLVEDDRAVRALVQNVLGKRGYKILEASGGDEAMRVALAHDGPIHLLLSDVMMPEMHGPDVANRLKPFRPQMKVMFMSGYVRPGGLDPTAEFMAKPFQPDTLVRRVREVLDKTAGEAEAVAAGGKGS